ncbi:expressed unknown protein [Seminavis robusta]|uniref:G-protein coupled receptors family 1 profile domain-containing protein n=1 Tax=Seminavis robusta TaxID=568900 RepID=A0A9N8DHK6_9STRA|nr:expressed unknown protein [Seminavis robusta]|eukprot:Sro132_g062380.1 n/a (443) ;mRNA; f:553-1881
MASSSSSTSEEYIWTEAPEEAESFSARHVTLAVIPHITGFLSLLGSTLIVVDVYRRRFETVYHRLLLGLAVSDIIASIGFFLSTWPIPEESMTSWGAIGNLQTCEFQGFLIQLGLATPLYNAALSIYYVLLVRFNWKQASREMIRFERVSHGVAVVLALGTAIASLVLNLYNDANLWCWIAPHPMDCVNSIEKDDGVGTCIRGDNAWVYRMAFYFCWLWASFVVVTGCMGAMVHAVYQQSTKMDRYRQAGEAPNKARWDRVQSVAIQSSLYILACILTALPVSIARILQAKYNCTSTYFPLSMTTVLFFPTQGLWNALIYFRPRVGKYWEEQRKRSQQSSSATISTSLGTAFTKFFSPMSRNTNSAASCKESTTHHASTCTTERLGGSPQMSTVPNATPEETETAVDASSKQTDETIISSDQNDDKVAPEVVEHRRNDSPIQ